MKAAHSNSKQSSGTEVHDLHERNKALEAAYELLEIVSRSLEFKEMTQKIADIIPQTLGYETGVLAIIDQQSKKLIRTTISHTPGGEAAVESLEIPFNEIIVPLDHTQNICIQALKDNEQKISYELYDVLRPAVSKKNADLVQSMMGTKISIVNPLYSHGKPLGILIASLSKTPEKLSEFERNTIAQFAKSVGIALEHSMLYDELKSAQTQLRDAYRALKLLDKQKDDFLSVASHELRTPMSIIKSYIWMLQDGKYGKLNPKQQKYADVAMRGTDRLIDLVNDMLNISRIEQNRMDFDINRQNICEVLQETVEGLQLKAKEKGIYLKVKEDCKGSTAYFDASKLKEIITNLVGNALKFTKKGGIIIKLEDSNGFIKVSIIDTGVGIKKEDLKALFRKFGRLDNSYTKVAESGGTGLGLHIVKLYTKKMGGKVGAFSEGDGKGSIFWFTLPKHKSGKEIKRVSKKSSTKSEKVQSVKISPKIKRRKSQRSQSKKAGARKEHITSLKPGT